MTTATRKQTYAYAVIDGNQDPADGRMADSCHYTIEAARTRCKRKNDSDSNAHYYVVEWDLARWDRLRPSPEHSGMIYGRHA